MPILVLADCSCVQKDTLAIQALFQEEFDGRYVHFRMQCLFCDAEYKIKEESEDFSLLPEAEGEVMLWLEKDSSDYLLQACLDGVTVSIPHEYKERGN